MVSPELAEFARARLADRPDFPLDVDAENGTRTSADRPEPASPRVPAPVTLRPKPYADVPIPAATPRRGRTVRSRSLSTFVVLAAAALGLLGGIELGGRNSQEVRTTAEFLSPAGGVSPSAATLGVNHTANTASRTGLLGTTATKPAARTSTVRRTSAPRLKVGPSSPTLRWSRVRGASYYDVRLFRRGVRVLDLWPSRPVVNVPRSWVYGGAHYRLQTGRYQWFVYPGIGKPLQLRLQKLHKAGVLVVRA
jgi:hypothetical protein